MGADSGQAELFQDRLAQAFAESVAWVAREQVLPAVGVDLGVLAALDELSALGRQPSFELGNLHGRYSTTNTPTINKYV
jgi:hypothetical protein